MPKRQIHVFEGISMAARRLALMAPGETASGTSASLDPTERPNVSFPGAKGSACGTTLRRADVAQLVEQRFCKPPVPGSSPVVGSKRE